MDFWMKRRARNGTGQHARVADWTPFHPPHIPVRKRGCTGYASAASLTRTGAARGASAASKLSRGVPPGTYPHDLDTAGHRRFSGARKSQGPGELRDAEPPNGLILMGVWCVRDTTPTQRKQGRVFDNRAMREGRRQRSKFGKEELLNEIPVMSGLTITPRIRQQLWCTREKLPEVTLQP